MGGLGTISDAMVHVGTPALRGALDDLASRAASSLHVDVFRVGDDAVVDTLAALSKRDVPLSVLADTDSASGKLVKHLRKQAGDAWHELGGDPLKQHGKSASRDGGLEALVGTDLADEDAARRIELAASFRGSAAEALGRVHAQSGGGTGLTDAIGAAAARGVVINDPRTGARHATEAVELLVDDHGGRLRIMTKAFDDEALAERIADAVRGQRMDTPAELLTHSIPKRQQKLLEEAGFVVREVDERDAERGAGALHGTLIDTNRGAFVGSPYLAERVLYGSGGRQSREVGVLLDGDAAAQARSAYDELVAAMP